MILTGFSPGQVRMAGLRYPSGISALVHNTGPRCGIPPGRSRGRSAESADDASLRAEETPAGAGGGRRRARRGMTGRVGAGPNGAGPPPR